jgi:hypothetical protein
MFLAYAPLFFDTFLSLYLGVKDFHVNGLVGEVHTLDNTNVPA